MKTMKETLEKMKIPTKELYNASKDVIEKELKMLENMAAQTKGEPF
jgi:hypothetical protein